MVDVLASSKPTHFNFLLAVHGIERKNPDLFLTQTHIQLNSNIKSAMHPFTQ